MDVLSDLLRRAGVGDPVVRQLIARPPWSLRFADAPALTLVATLGGHAHVLREGSVRLDPGDLALVRGGAPYTIADDPATPPQAVIEGGRKRLIGDLPPSAPRGPAVGAPGAGGDPADLVPERGPGFGVPALGPEREPDFGVPALGPEPIRSRRPDSRRLWTTPEIVGPGCLNGPHPEGGGGQRAPADHDDECTPDGGAARPPPDHAPRNNLDIGAPPWTASGPRFASAGAVTRGLAPRTYGAGLPGATVMLRGAFDQRGDVGLRLLEILPPVAVVPAGPRTRAALDLLAAEIVRDEPGQDAVLHRVLDLVLVLALRAWCAGPDAAPPGWYRALGDPAIGAALRLVHTSPDRRWTVAGLAAEVGLSRAGFAARFAALVGEPPLTYLTAWRMTLAADLLRGSAATVAVVARAVGYDDPFAFSVAFKRHRGVTPSDWRRGAPQSPRPPES